MKNLLQRAVLAVQAALMLLFGILLALTPADCFLRTASAAEGRFGIDISKYQEQIDWQAVREGGVEFAIIRCCKVIHAYDDFEEDERFEENYEGARAAGIAVGAYMYTDAATAEEFTGDVDFMLAVLKDKSFDLPVFLDLESASRQEHLPPAVFMPALTAGLERIEEGGFTAGIYSSTAFFSECIDRRQLQAEHYAIWEANYFNTIDGLKSPAGHDLSDEADIWQYSGRGKTAGIRTTVDCNLCYADSYFLHEARALNPELPEGALREGAKFTVGGTVSADAVIRKITGEIYSVEDDSKPIQQVSVSPNAKEYLLTGFFTKKLDFSALKCGEYRFRLSAVDSSGADLTVAESRFTVTKDGLPLATTTTTTQTTATTTVTEGTKASASASDAAPADTKDAAQRTKRRRSGGFARWWLGFLADLYDNMPGRWFFASAASLTLRLSLERTPLHRIFARMSTFAEIGYLASGIGKEIV
ncbi:MAG: hypothetical protein IJ060_05990 [Oscillospiraceae bacterium]|nr:hypothetical protein [Oscillospiraceae bacterium]